MDICWSLVYLNRTMFGKALRASAVNLTGAQLMGMCFTAVFWALAVGMRLFLEQAGLFSLAHPTFFGLGAYVSGILAVRGIAPPWLGSLIGTAFVACISYAVGAPILRPRAITSRARLSVFS